MALMRARPLRRSGLDVALLDLGLPKKNGYEIARHFRTQAWGKNMVIIAVTGWGEEEDRRRSGSQALTAIWSSPSSRR